MRMEQLNAMWEQIAVHIGERVLNCVNTPETIGTDDETGYILLFFNMRQHPKHEKAQARRKAVGMSYG